MKAGYTIQHNDNNDRIGVGEYDCNVAFIDCFNYYNHVLITYYKNHEPSFTPSTVAVLRLKPKKQ